MALRILVVDDESAQRLIVSEILRDEGHEVESAASGRQAVALLERSDFDLVVTDLMMADGDGLHVLKEGRRLQPELTVLLMTAFGTVSTAVEAMKSGAWDFLQKPFQKDELIERVRRVAERQRLLGENRRLKLEVAAREGPKLLGDSPSMRRLLRAIERLAAVPGDVLVTGESGTGKELVAHALHAASPRAGRPFVAVNCAAIPAGLAESELFGHEKGAFTHAVAARAGRFEQADSGTLFLDEIAAMDAALQAKLLRVLEDRVIERVGSDRKRPVDLRVVAATNRSLPELIARGAFREDLYHRLNVHELHLSPLRERGDDVALLAEHFRDRAAVRFGLPAPPIDGALLEFLRGYRFPGNVRELLHIMEKMVALSDGEPLSLSDLPPSVRRPTAVGDPNLRSASAPRIDSMVQGSNSTTQDREAIPHGPETLFDAGAVSLFEVERRLLAEAIRLSGGNLSEAARRVGLSYKTMRYRAQKFGLAGEDEASSLGPDDER